MHTAESRALQLLQQRQTLQRRWWTGVHYLCASQRSSRVGSGGWSTARFTLGEEAGGAATANSCTTDELPPSSDHARQQRGGE